VKPILYRILFIVTSFIVSTQVLTQPPGVCTKPLLDTKPIHNSKSLPAQSHPSFDDWVVCEDGNFLCGGYYCEVPPPFPNAPPEFLQQQPLTVTSGKAEFNDLGNTTLLGNVHLIQGNRQLLADKAIIHRGAQKKIETIEACGHVRLLEPGLRLEGTRAEVSVPNDVKTIENAEFRLYNQHARGTSSSITAFSDSRLFIHNLTYTTCSPFQNTWELRANLADLNRVTGRGEAHHAKMYIKGLPLFYLPYASFPIDDRRQTGFLFPNVGVTKKSGFEMSFPFYWNIAPNYDATITPRVLSRRGGEMQGQFRYLLANSEGEFRGAYLLDDHAYRDFRKNKFAFPQFPASDPRTRALRRGDNSRKLFFARNSTNFDRHWSGNLNFLTVGDDNYFMDLGDTLRTAGSTQLLQQASLNYQDDYWKGTGRVQAYQTLYPYQGPVTTEPYRQLPHLSLANDYPDLPCGFEWTMYTEYTNFTRHRDPFTLAASTQGNRYYLRPGLSYPLIRPWGFFKPRVQMDLLAYSLRLNPTDIRNGLPKSPTRHLPIVDVDMGLIFERPLDICGNNVVQTLEPRAYYLYVPFQDQNKFPNFDTTYPGFDFNQLYRENRFSGFDRLGDANQITLGVTSRFLSGITGTERINVNVGQIYYFRDRKVTLANAFLNPNVLNQEMPDRKKRLSPIAGFGRLRLNDGWFAVSAVEWDVYRNEVDKSGVWLQYQPCDANVINLGYQFLRRNPVKVDPITGINEKLYQTDASFAWKLTEEFRLLGRWNYDIQNNRTNEVLAGLEHQGCCTAFRLAWIHFLLPNAGQLAAGRPEYNNGIFFQFVFKGFAGVGNTGIKSTLSRSIPGYQWRGSDF